MHEIVELLSYGATIVALIVSIIAYNLAIKSHKVAATEQIADWFQRAIYAWGMASHVKFKSEHPKTDEIDQAKREIYSLIEEGRLFAPEWSLESNEKSTGQKQRILSILVQKCYNSIDDPNVNKEKFDYCRHEFISIAHAALPRSFQKAVRGYDRLY